MEKSDGIKEKKQKKEKPRRSKGEGSVRQRADGMWEARYSAGFDIYGKRMRPTIVGESEKIVRRNLINAISKVNRGEHTDSSTLTLEQWVRRWLEVYKKGKIKDITYSRYFGTLELTVCNNPIGKIKLSKLTNDHIQKWINDLSKTRDPNTVSVYYTILKSALIKAHAIRILPYLPTVGAELPEKEDSQGKAFDLEQQHTFVNAVKGHKYEHFFILCLSTGMRLGEMLALKWTDVNFEKKTIHVHATYQTIQVIENGAFAKKVEYVYEDTAKTKAGTRTIPLIETSENALRKIRANQKINQAKTGLRDEIIFVSEDFKGDIINRMGIHSCLKRLLKKNNLDQFSFHSLRHTFATRGLENGIDMKVMQEILGHADYIITANLYSHVTKKNLNDSMAKLEGIFTSKTPLDANRTLDTNIDVVDVAIASE